MRLAIEASDPEHPAHEFYQNRHNSILIDMTSVDWELPEEYRDPERLHDLIVTAFFAMDGVQIQSLTNPNESMMQLWERAERILFPSPHGTATAEQSANKQRHRKSKKAFACGDR